MTTVFVEMYHPLIPSTSAEPRQVPVQAVDDYEARGWLLVDPEAVVPDSDLPYATVALVASQLGAGGTPIGDAARAAFGPVPEFTWPEGLVAFFPLAPGYVTADGGLQNADGIGRWVADKVAGTVQFDATDPGPFGPSLVFGGPSSVNAWSVGGMEPQPGEIGALDLSRFGDEFTVINWVRPTDVYGNMSFRFGSHIEAGSRSARQYGSYYNGVGYGGPFRYVPHLGAQDDATPGFRYNLDFPSTARQYTGRWAMEAGTFDGTKMVAYLDGLADFYEHYSDFADPPYEQRVDISKNPYYPIYGDGGLNPSDTTKGFTIGGTFNGTDPYEVVNPMKGRMSGALVFNRALTPDEIMAIRLAFLMPGEAIATFDFFAVEVHGLPAGLVPASTLGWRSIAGQYAQDKSWVTNSGYRILGATGTDHLARVADAYPAVAWFPLDGLRSTHVRRVTFDLNSTLAADPQRVIVKVGGSWYASETTFDTTVEHADEANWSAKESKELALDFAAGNWRTLAFTESGTGNTYTTTFENQVTNPSGETGWTGWTKLGSNGGVLSESETTVTPRAGTKARRYTVTTAPASGLMTICDVDAYGGFAAGSQVACGVYVRPSISTRILATAVFYTAADALLGTKNGTPLDCPANVWTFVPYVGDSFPTATKAKIRPTGSSSGTLPPIGTTFDADAAVLVEGTEFPPDTYFDGDTAGATWTGTPHASTSTKAFDDEEGGDPITLGGAALATRIQAGDLQGVGFYSPAGSGTHRVRNLQLWRKPA